MTVKIDKDKPLRLSVRTRQQHEQRQQRRSGQRSGQTMKLKALLKRINL